MSGSKSGVVTRLCTAEPRAVFTNCYGHSLNFTCSYAAKQCKLMQDALDTTHETTKSIKRHLLVMHSSRGWRNKWPVILLEFVFCVRPGGLSELKPWRAFLIITMCVWIFGLSRWSVWSIQRWRQGFKVLLLRWWSLTTSLVSLLACESYAGPITSANNAAEGQVVVAMTVSTLKSECNDASFKLFWKKVAAPAVDFPIDEPTLPCRHKLPLRLHDGSAPTFHVTVKDYYRAIYLRSSTSWLQAFMTVSTSPIIRPMQAYDQELQFVLSFLWLLVWCLSPTNSSGNLFSRNFQAEQEVVVPVIITFFWSCTSGQLEVMSQVTKLVRLLLVMPATNSTIERSFNALWRIKKHLSSTMSQQRKNHLMLLHIHKNHTQNFNLVDAANDPLLVMTTGSMFLEQNSRGLDDLISMYKV